MTDLATLEADLAHLAPMLLPSEARALTLEVVREQVAVRVYLDGRGSLERWADLDAEVTPIVERRVPAGPTWSVIVQAVRQDRPEPLEVFGAVMWVEDGSTIARRDGRAAGQ